MLRPPPSSTLHAANKTQSKSNLLKLGQKTQAFGPG